MLHKLYYIFPYKFTYSISDRDGETIGLLKTLKLFVSHNTTLVAKNRL